MDASD